MAQGEGAHMAQAGYDSPRGNSSNLLGLLISRGLRCADAAGQSIAEA